MVFCQLLGAVHDEFFGSKMRETFDESDSPPARKQAGGKLSPQLGCDARPRGAASR